MKRNFMLVAAIVSGLAMTSCSSEVEVTDNTDELEELVEDNKDAEADGGVMDEMKDKVGDMTDGLMEQATDAIENGVEEATKKGREMLDDATKDAQEKVEKTVKDMM